MDRRERKETQGKTANQEGPGTTDVQDPMVSQDPEELTATKERAEMMDLLGLMESLATEEPLVKRVSKGYAGTGDQEEIWETQAPVESQVEKDRLAEMENLAEPARSGHLATEGTKAHPDSRVLKAREESKALQETEGRWGRGEKMA